MTKNIKKFLLKAGAFIKRDFAMMVSYRAAFFMHWFGVIISLLVFYFIAKLFSGTANPYLRQYNGDYFSFVLIGIAFSGYLSNSLGVFAGGIRQEQTMGTLEAMLVTPTKLTTIIISLSLSNFILTSITVMAYLIIGTVFLNADMSNANLSTAFLILAISIICFSSIGIISASFIMVFKRGNPINWVMGTTAQLLGGTYFPIAILPQFLKIFSRFIPLTYSLKALRMALLRGASVGDLSFEIAVLILFCILLLPLSFVIFKFALKKAKKDASLIHY
jgi:ABC-2 type transport system permease protein